MAEPSPTRVVDVSVALASNQNQSISQFPAGFVRY